MENFIYDIPAKVYFGKNQIHALHEVIKEYGSHVLIVYGGGSIKKSGIYDQVIEELNKAKTQYWELSGVEANPRIETVRKGVDLCDEHKVEVILPAEVKS